MGKREIVGREEHTSFLSNEDISFFTIILLEKMVFMKSGLVLLDFICDVGEDLSELKRVC